MSIIFTKQICDFLPMYLIFDTHFHFRTLNLPVPDANTILELKKRENTESVGKVLARPL